MIDLFNVIQTALHQRAAGEDPLERPGHEIVDLIEIPARGDRMVRVQTVEEALEEFDRSGGEGAVSYLIQLRPRIPSLATAPAISRVAGLLGAGATAAGPAISAMSAAARGLGTGPQSTSSEPKIFSATSHVGATGTGTGAVVVATTGPANGPETRSALNNAIASATQAPLADSSHSPSANPGVSSSRNPFIGTPADAVYLADGKLNTPFLLQNAEVLFRAKEFALSRNIYATVLKTGEKSSLAHYWIGRCLEAESKGTEAQRHYEESIAFHPTLDAYQRLTALLIQTHKEQQAAELLERALALPDLTVKVRFEMHKACGNAWSGAQATAKAEAHYRQALTVDPAADSIHTNLGALYVQASRLPEARQSFAAATSLNAANDKAFAGLANCALAEGRSREAHDFFAKSLDIQINNPTGVFHLVKCAYEIKSYATAARIVGEYVQSAPVNANLLYSLAGLQFHLGRMNEAQSTVHQILALQPDHAGAAELARLIEKFVKTYSDSN